MPAKSLHAPQIRLTDVPSRSEWRALASMAPSALGLISFNSAVKQGFELVSNGVRKHRFRDQLGSAQATLRSAAIPMLVEERRDQQALVAPKHLKRRKRRWLGQMALELYFAQLFRSDTAILDLSPSRLGVTEDGEAVWRPRPLYVRWDPHFLDGVRDVYAGFFLDDDERFERGISRLGLASGGRALIRHFGEGNQRGVRFSSKSLAPTLERLAAANGAHGGPLHPNFVAFGLYAASLHRLLESLDMAFDVRSAFRRVYRDGR